MLMNFDAMMHIFCVRKNISRLINKMMIKMNVLSASDFFFSKLETVLFQPPRQTPYPIYLHPKFQNTLGFQYYLFWGEKLICYSSLVKYEYFIQSQDISFWHDTIQIWQFKKTKVKLRFMYKARLGWNTCII